MKSLRASVSVSVFHSATVSSLSFTFASGTTTRPGGTVLQTKSVSRVMPTPQATNPRMAVVLRPS